MNVDQKIQNALASLGNDISLPDLTMLEHLERFVVTVYNNSLNIKTFENLRWHLFSKFQKDADKLPPTMSALKYKIFRSNYITLVWK